MACGAKPDSESSHAEMTDTPRQDQRIQSDSGGAGHTVSAIGGIHARPVIAWRITSKAPRPESFARACEIDREAQVLALDSAREVIGGVDTRATHHAAVIDPTGRNLADFAFALP